MSGHHRHHPPHHDDGYSASSTTSSAGSMSPSGSFSAEAELSIVELLEAELRYVNQQLQKSHQQLLRQSELQLDNDEVDEDEETVKLVQLVKSQEPLVRNLSYIYQVLSHFSLFS